jgi:hypothetical protein
LIYIIRMFDNARLSGFFNFPVSNIYARIDSNHQKIHDVKPDNTVIAVKYFVQNSRDIAHNHDIEEKDAFPFRASRNIRTVYGKRPRGAETEKHRNFKYTHNKPSERRSKTDVICIITMRHKCCFHLRIANPVPKI